jgi:hypothetical protein
VRASMVGLLGRGSPGPVAIVDDRSGTVGVRREVCRVVRDRVAELAVRGLSGECLIWQLRSHGHGYWDRHTNHLWARLEGILHLLGNLGSVLRLELLARDHSVVSMLRQHVLSLLRVLLGLGPGVWHCPACWHAVHR